MSKAPSTRGKRKGYEYLGEPNSYGVRIIKPYPAGRRNLTDQQIRQIVDGLLERTGHRKKPEAAE
jgi:hypothetical protein